jgi:hypothetical protein
MPRSPNNASFDHCASCVAGSLATKGVNSENIFRVSLTSYYRWVPFFFTSSAAFFTSTAASFPMCQKESMQMCMRHQWTSGCNWELKGYEITLRAGICECEESFVVCFDTRCGRHTGHRLFIHKKLTSVAQPLCRIDCGSYVSELRAGQMCSLIRCNANLWLSCD